MARDTSSGKTFEDIVELCILRSCKRNGLDRRAQSKIGLKIGGGQHVVDWEIWEISNPDRRALISAKVQNTGGSAEEKIPYEILKLLHAMDNDSRFKFAWLILGGAGWSLGLLDYYRNSLNEAIPAMDGRVKILRTDELLSLNLKIP